MLFYLTSNGCVDLNTSLSSLISGMGVVLMRLVIPNRALTIPSFPEIPLMEEDA